MATIYPRCYYEVEKEDAGLVQPRGQMPYCLKGSRGKRSEKNSRTRHMYVLHFARDGMLAHGVCS